MTSRISQWTLDVHDVALMAEFWSGALGYRADLGDDGCAKLYPPDEAGPEAPTVWLQSVTSTKRGKNRNHPDLRPRDGDVSAEVARLIGLGARPADVGQTEHDPFVVLADPEGNEFCVLQNEPRPTVRPADPGRAAPSDARANVPDARANVPDARAGTGSG